MISDYGESNTELQNFSNNSYTAFPATFKDTSRLQKYQSKSELKLLRSLHFSVVKWN